MINFSKTSGSAKQLGISGKSPKTDCDSKCPCFLDHKHKPNYLQRMYLEPAVSPIVH